MAGCASCGGKSRRPMRTTQGGSPVTQTPTQSNSREANIRQQVNKMRWTGK